VVAEPVPSRVALVVHPKRPIEGALATLKAWAAEHGVDVVQLAVDGDRHREVAPPGTLEDGDLVVAVGGDGTVLAALHAAAPKRAPVLGVACGSLGALSAVTADRLEEGLGRLWAGDWRAKSLPALAIAEDGGPDEWAANDFVVVRRGAGQLVAEITVDDELYARTAGDGLIVATAMGSSAYSMAAGGPVLAAGAAAFVCTPLAMHGGSAPPLVVSGDAVVRIVVSPSFAGFDVEIDGRERRGSGLRFRLSLDPDRLTLVSFGPSGRGLAGLRKRGLITDSPRVLAREARDGRATG
jgi:NAD+ kinase